ncbi:MAG: GIY-YIG nuclease family protein [Patescibacteria group bacterium]
MFWVYILKSLKNNSYYTGSCGNVDKRLNLHNNGLVKSTKGYIPWDLVYKEKFESLSLARSRELQIKSWKKRSYIESLIETFHNF